MDIAVMLLLDRSLPGISPDDLEGRQIFAEQKLLDNLAEKSGVRPLSDFTSMSDVDCADFLGDDIEGLDEIPSVEWFDANQGLVTVEALLEAIVDEETVGANKELEAELESFRTVLKSAANADVRFRYMIAM
ncbi:hypothetical protein Mal52_07190 [Symmachiella dynata]|uniref:Uncharacterized protein n=1 Tax=Symmachiella dynata TaxID=2527995 RepID=A0A517ZIF9_9PLAN|nr:hypothetical protein [Symmachiella dynata]QDU42263.1 hypothetical protein Mal52_07190 [Symmachiella dynata]